MFQGHVYSLIGAVGDNRFALMHAGYKHAQGIDGFTKDLDVAYSYYSNAGAQSSADSSRLHEKMVCNPYTYVCFFFIKGRCLGLIPP